MGTLPARVKGLDSSPGPHDLAHTALYLGRRALGLCSVVFGVSLVGSGPDVWSLPLASGCGVGCQSLETSQNDLAGRCFVCRGETWGPEWVASLSGVGVGQWS